MTCCCCCCCWAMGKCCSTHVVPGLWFGWSLSSHQKLFQTPLECLFISPSVCYDPQTLSPVQFTFLWASPESHSSEPVRVRPVWISFHFISFVPSADCHHFRLLFNSLSFVFLCHSDDMKLKSYFTSLGSIILAQNVQGQASLLFCAFCICKNYISPNMFQI